MGQNGRMRRGALLIAISSNHSGITLSHSRSRMSVLLAGALLVVAGCGSTHVRTSATPSATVTTPTPFVPTPTPSPPPLSQPLLVQVENLYEARPQSGLSEAQLLYEYQTEGGISRFTAIFFGTPPGPDLVGPVRSARLVDLRLLQIYGGALLYSGASNYTLAELRSSGLKQYSPDDTVVGDTVLYRTSAAPPAARYGSPHNLYTNGSELASLSQKIGLSTVGYQLWPRTPVTDLPDGGTPVSSFEVPLSPEETPLFTYQPTDGSYERSEPATPLYPATGVLDDANTDQPWETPTIVVLQVPVIPVPADNENPSGGYTEGLDFGIGPNSGGNGQVAVGGLLYSIIWNQGATGPPELTLTDGAPAPIAPGQVLIELVPQGRTVTTVTPVGPAT